MSKNLKLITERQEGNTIIRSFIVSEDRQQADQRIITDVKRIFAVIKKKTISLVNCNKIEDLGNS